MVTFDLHARRFDVVVPETGDPDVVLRRAVVRRSVPARRTLMAVQSFHGPMLYMDASLNQWRVNPVGIEFFYWSQSGLKHRRGPASSRWTPYDAALAASAASRSRTPTGPEVGSVPSPDGQRVYLTRLPTRGTGPRHRSRCVCTCSTRTCRPATVTTLPLLGSFELTDYPMCWPRPSYSNCLMPVVTMSFDQPHAVHRRRVEDDVRCRCRRCSPRTAGDRARAPIDTLAQGRRGHALKMRRITAWPAAR